MARIWAGRLADSLRVVTAALLGLAVVRCSATSSNPVPHPTPTRASGRTSDTSRSPVASSSSPGSSGPIESSVDLECRNYIDHDPPPPDFENVLGVVALPTSSRAAALQTSRTPGADSPVRLFAKTGLVIRAGTTFELVVPH